MAKPFFSDKCVVGNNIVLIDGEEIYQVDQEAAKILWEFLNNAVKSLNVCLPIEYISEQFAVSNDTIRNIISKYFDHPSIKLINDNVTKGSFSFNRISLDDVKNEIAKLDVKKASLSSSICQNVRVSILKPHTCYLVESSSCYISKFYTTSEPKNRSPCFYDTL